MRSDRPAPILVEHALRPIPEDHPFRMDGAPHPCRVGACFVDELFQERRISSVEWELLRGGIWPRRGWNGASLLVALSPGTVDLRAAKAWIFDLPPNAPNICRRAVSLTGEMHERFRISVHERDVLLCAIWPRDRDTLANLAEVRSEIATAEGPAS